MNLVALIYNSSQKISGPIMEPCGTSFIFLSGKRKLTIHRGFFIRNRFIRNQYSNFSELRN